MTQRTYPYKGWTLQPAFKPVEIELVEKYQSYMRDDYGDCNADGKVFMLSNIFPSKAAAIVEGHVRLLKQQADLDKKQANLQKRINALNKAAAS